MSTRGQISIAPATPADVPLLLELIGELAAFERLGHEAVATADDLLQNLFGPEPTAEAVIARDGAAVTGFALFFHNFSTFLGRPGLYLEDLFVRPEFRGRGVGAALLRHLAALALQRKCGRFEWSVLDWNQRAIDFYKGLGAVPMSEWTVFRVSGTALEALAAQAPPTTCMD